jgi:hypothetical protein
MSIDDFNNTSHYLPILNASILADIIVLIIVYYTPFFNSKFLMKYYEEYRLGAIIADVLILVIGMIIARYHYKTFFNEFSILNFLVLALVIQIIHDILFFLFFSSVPVGKNKFLDIFKKYAKEVSWGAILGDSFMIILTVLFSVYFSKQSYNYNIILLTVLVYLIPYVLYTR